jgi:predicted amidophosphoribosyltransferase
MKKEKDFTSCCYVCKKTTQNFEVCQECKTMNSELKIEKQITLNNDKLNISHNINLPSDVYYDKIIILTNYSKLISKLIKDAKFYNKKEIFEDFTIYLYDKFLANQKVESLNDYLIISIPTYFLRKWKR